MDAARLVDQRMAGKITQDEFFVALNQLRRANRDIHTRPAARAGTANILVRASEHGNPPEQIEGTKSEAKGSWKNLASPRSSFDIGERINRVGRKSSVCDVQVDGSSSSTMCSCQEATTEPMPLGTPESAPSPTEDGGDGGYVRQVLGTSSRLREGEHAIHENHHYQVHDAGDHSTRSNSFRESNSARVSDGLTDGAFCTPVDEQKEISPMGEEVCQQTGDGGRLFSAREEVQNCKCQLHETTESRRSSAVDCSRIDGNSYRGYAISSAPLPYSSFVRAARSCTPQSDFFSVGGCTRPPYSYRHVARRDSDRSPAAKSSRFSSSMAKITTTTTGSSTNISLTPVTRRAATESGGACTARFGGIEGKHGRNCSKSARKTSPIVTTLTLSPLEDGVERFDASEARRTTNAGSRGPVGRSVGSDKNSVHNLPEEFSSSSAQRHEKGGGIAPATARARPSRNETIFNLNFEGYNTRARVGSYGYSLHEKKGLGSTGDAKQRYRFSFAPTTKSLPDFYHAKQKRGLEFSKGRSGVTRGKCCLEQPISLYERTMDWQAKKNEVRARKMAQQEEAEIAGCTFRPSILRRRSNAARSRASGNVRSGSYDAPGEGGKRGSGRSEGAGPVGRESGLMLGQRLFEESERLNERRSQDQERRRAWDEESLAQSCTFQPSLVKGPGSCSIKARARYMDAPTTPARAAKQALDHSLTFHPKIVGVRPDMTRAIKYVSVGCVERLHRVRTINGRRPKSAGFPDGYGRYGGGVTSRPETWESGHQYRLPCTPRRSPCPRNGDIEGSSGRDAGNNLRFGPFSTNERRVALERRSGSIFQGQGDVRNGENRLEVPQELQDYCDDFGFRRPGRQPLPQPQPQPQPQPRPRPQQKQTHCSCCYCRGRWPGGEGGDERTEVWSRPARYSYRPRSAPARDRDMARGRAGEAWGKSGDFLEVDEKLNCGERMVGWGKRPGEAVGGEAPMTSTNPTASMERGSAQRSAHRRGRQTAISFREFLKRQSQNQATAGQHLRHLKSLHSPSFTPQLSRGTQRLAAQNGPLAGGGTFKERLELTDQRRSRVHKVATSKAMAKQKEACTFSPRLTLRSRLARSRSVRERSIGDSVVKAAKQRLARAREDTRLLDDDSTADTFTFTPSLATARGALAPQASSRLRLAAELDTYLERVQDAKMHRDGELSEQRRRANADEDRACTFRPAINDCCPQLVRHTAAGMRCIREFRRLEALSSAKHASTTSKPGWR